MPAFLLLSLLFLSGCSGNSETPLSPSSIGHLSLEHIVASVSSDGIQGVRVGGGVVAGSGPAVTATGNQTVINGGTLTVLVTAATPFQKVYVYAGVEALGIESAAQTDVGGFYEITLPAPQTSASLLLAFPQTIPVDAFDLLFAGADASGNVGPFARLTTEVTRVGTGDIQVTLSWDTDADVDLHVVEPGGEETYYGHRQSATGGALDLDSNAACSTDGVRNENITWPIGRATRGTYTVRVDYWSNCGAAVTNYTVRINNGGDVQVFSGSFTGPGDQGGAGSGVTVATFERLTGRNPVPGGSNVQTTGGRAKEVAGAAGR